MALTDQAIAKIKELIVSGEFAPGSKIPKEPRQGRDPTGISASP